MVSFNLVFPTVFDSLKGRKRKQHLNQPTTPQNQLFESEEGDEKKEKPLNQRFVIGKGGDDDAMQRFLWGFSA